jgi:2-polyprenyl-3-methyl-5-hydroxy-6-metoxy-1,4-benzoquinol methylase
MSEASKYENTNSLHRYLLNRFLSSITQAVRSTGRQAIVEIGCADGYVYEFLRDHAEVPFNYAGFDVDLEALDRARTRFPGIAFERGSIYDFKANADLVLCLEVLEHLEEPENALRHLAALDASDFIVSVPHEPWFALGNFARGRHIATFGNLPDHVNRWTKAQFRRQISPWFEIVKDYSSFPWIAYRLRKATI